VADEEILQSIVVPDERKAMMTAIVQQFQSGAITMSQYVALTNSMPAIGPDAPNSRTRMTDANAALTNAVGPNAPDSRTRMTDANAVVTNAVGPGAPDSRTRMTNANAVLTNAVGLDAPDSRTRMTDANAVLTFPRFKPRPRRKVVLDVVSADESDLECTDDSDLQAPSPKVAKQHAAQGPSNTSGCTPRVVPSKNKRKFFDVTATVEQEWEETEAELAAFSKRFKPCKSSHARPRKVPKLPPPKGKKTSNRKQGTRKSDVSPATMKLRLQEFPGNKLRIEGGQLFCGACNGNIGSGKTEVQRHCLNTKHTKNLTKAIDRGARTEERRNALQEYQENFAKENDGARVASLHTMPEAINDFRAETVGEFIEAGGTFGLISRLRKHLENQAGMPLTESSHLARTFVPPLVLAEKNLLREEHEGQLFAIGHDDTPNDGEMFIATTKIVTESLDFLSRVANVEWLESNPDNKEISSMLIKTSSLTLRKDLGDLVSVTSDSLAPNKLSFEDKIAVVAPNADLNLCNPHAYSNTRAEFCTPTVDEFMSIYNNITAHSNRAKKVFREVTGIKIFSEDDEEEEIKEGANPKKGAGNRWFTVDDVQELTLLPTFLNGKLLDWAETLVAEGVCEASAGKMVTLLTKPRKKTLFWLELVMAVVTGKTLKINSTKLEGDTFEILYAYDLNLEIMSSLKSPITSEIKAEIEKIAAQAPARVSGSDHTPAIEANQVEDHRVLALLQAPSLSGIRVGIQPPFWNWNCDPPTTEQLGTIAPSATKAKILEVDLCVKWDDASQGKTEKLFDQGDGTTYLTQEGLNFRLLPYSNGAPAPEYTKPSPAHLLATGDLQDTRVLTAIAEGVIAPAYKYCTNLMQHKRHNQMQRYRAVRIFNPLFAKGNPVTQADLDALQRLKCAKHRRVKPHVAKLPDEVALYNQLCEEIKDESERTVTDPKTNTTKDTWDIKQWWLSVKNKVPAFFQVLRVVLLHSPNNCACERAFSIVNDSFRKDQKAALEDYVELSVMLQYNNRTRDRTKRANSKKFLRNDARS